MTEFIGYLLDIGKVGFAVGACGLVGIFAGGLLGWGCLLELSKLVFILGFVPLFGCLFVAMVLHHLYGRRG